MFFNRGVIKVKQPFEENLINRQINIHQGNTVLYIYYIKYNIFFDNIKPF